MRYRTAFCLVFLVLLFTGAAWAEGEDALWFTGDGEVYNSLGEHFCYKVEDGHAVLDFYWLEDGRDQPASVYVPAKMNGIPLTAVGRRAFDNWDGYEWRGERRNYDGDKVERVVIPEGVTVLEEGAFCEAHGVREILLPSTLNEIRTGLCFYHVTASLSFPNGNDVYRIEDGFLIDSRTDALIYCDPDARDLPLPCVRRIEARALYNYACYQKTLEFPDSVEYIGGYNAFDCVSIETIIVPGSVKEIADHGLFCNSAASIILNEGLQKIGAYAFTETEAGRIVVPSTVIWIGYGAFAWPGLEPVIQNPDCVLETEAQYRTRVETIDGLTVFYNPDGGRFYHIDPECPSVDPYYLPLVPVHFGDIDSPACDHLQPCPLCAPPERPSGTETAELPLESDEDEADSNLRVLEYRYGYNGLEFLRIRMKDGSSQVFTVGSLPLYCWLDDYHDGDAILIEYCAQMDQSGEVWDTFSGEEWFMTFEYIDGDWHLTDITNGWDWMADADHGIYTFDDYSDCGGTWQWSAEFGDRLTEFDFVGMAKLIDMYNAAMPDRPSLQ